jgi:tetratricopeptide (TPR) repeat protein
MYFGGDSRHQHFDFGYGRTESGMHWEQTQFVRSVRALVPQFFEDSSVLEIGSYNINGSVRPIFTPGVYIGVDLVPGPSVDIVGSGDEILLDRRFDTTISCECFEHNPRYLETFRNMVRHARPGGMVLFSCASTGRAEHGTSRTTPLDSPGTVARGWSYYRNLVPADFDYDFLNTAFCQFRFFDNRGSNDLYFVGFTSGLNIDYAYVLDALGRSAQTLEKVSRALRWAHNLQKKKGTSSAYAFLQRASVRTPVAWQGRLLDTCSSLLAQMERLEEAEQTLRRAMATLGVNAEILCRLSNILSRSGKIEAALSEAQMAVKFEPDNAWALSTLGNILLSLQRVEEAERLFSRAIEINPDLAFAHQQLSYCHVVRGEFDKALEPARRAVEIDSDVAIFRLHLDQVLTHLNRPLLPSSSANPNHMQHDS